jgi:hypothetical protein
MRWTLLRRGMRTFAWKYAVRLWHTSVSMEHCSSWSDVHSMVHFFSEVSVVLLGKNIQTEVQKETRK